MPFARTLFCELYVLKVVPFVLRTKKDVICSVGYGDVLGMLEPLYLKICDVGEG